MCFVWTQLFVIFSLFLTVIPFGILPIFCMSFMLHKFFYSKYIHWRIFHTINDTLVLFDDDDSIHLWLKYCIYNTFLYYNLYTGSCLCASHTIYRTIYLIYFALLYTITLTIISFTNTQLILLCYYNSITFTLCIFLFDTRNCMEYKNTNWICAIGAEKKTYKFVNLPIQWPFPSERFPPVANEVFPFCLDDVQMQLHMHYEYYLPNFPIQPIE